MGIWLNDGSYEPLFGNERQEFANVIREKLGSDAEVEFLKLSDLDEAYACGYYDGQQNASV